MLEMRASVLARAGRSEEAAAQYTALLATNPDHYHWHSGLQAALGLKVRACPAARSGIKITYSISKSKSKSLKSP